MNLIQKNKNFPAAYKFFNHISKYFEYTIPIELIVSEVDALKEIIKKEKIRN